MLIILGGPDRVGKSTLAAELSQLSGYSVAHHSVPDQKASRIFDCYYQRLEEGESQIWDRSYVCAYILERFRKNTHDHFVEIVDLELALRKKHKVVHVGVYKPWFWAAPHHIAELNELYPELSAWAKRDMLIARQLEHHFYIEQMEEFYSKMTMFPSFMAEPDWTAERILANALSIVSDGFAEL